MSGRVPAEVFPPGEIVRDELEARGWTQDVFAEILGRPARLVNEIISGKRGITPETAKALGEALETDPQFWLNLEGAYRLSKSKGGGEGVARRAKLYSAAPVKDMIRRQWIEAGESIDELERGVLDFFEVGTVDEIASLDLCAAARKSTDYAETNAPQRAWFCRVKSLASTLPVGRFRKRDLGQMLASLHAFTVSEQEARRVPRLLAEYGIRFVVVEHLPRTRIDGAAMWLDPDSPVVAVSLRYDRIDAFWFTLAHELGHIYYEHASGIDSDLAADGQAPNADLSEEELLANTFACNFLVSKDEIDSFIARVRPLYSRSRINRFANRIQIHPGIIIGQLQKRGEIKFSQGREMLVKVRDIVTQSAVTDGWGHYPTAPF